MIYYSGDRNITTIFFGGKEMKTITDIRSQLLSGDLTDITSVETVLLLNTRAMELLEKEPLNQKDVADLTSILNICNILYNNTDIDPLPIEDGLYDLLMVKIRRYDSNYQVGAEPIRFDESIGNLKDEPKAIIKPIKHMNPETLDNMLFYDELITTAPFDPKDYIIYPIGSIDAISKRQTNTPHNYPKLVGTLDKCKYVMNYQAKDRGAFDDDNVQIFERDFIGPHISSGLVNPDNITLVVELKYDGISVEADINGNEIESARSRGDTNNDEASDLTPILKGYQFRHAPKVDSPFGMKFEAVISYNNLAKLAQIRNKEYKNARNAIIGLFGSTDANLYKDFITLVPLETSLDGMNRVEELEFMNKYYHSGEICRYAVISGPYVEVMYQLTKFVDEAEYMREFLPIMYDGVVVSYLDENIRKALGRENSVNKYSMAIKFNAMKKQTTFLGYTYTVGQDGVITPMIHYAPVEFYGMVNTHSTGHSLKRFNELGLRMGDILSIEFTNDVMAYVSKPDISANENNPNPIIQFITHCPECGTPLRVSDTGKSIYCDNKDCPGRKLARTTNMLKKLNFKDFAEESIAALNIHSFSEFMEMTLDKAYELLGGDITPVKLINNIKILKEEPIYDYRIVGSLGFTNLAAEKWKLILSVLHINDIITMDDDNLSAALSTIKGIGKVGINTILNERQYFMEDLKYMLNNFNIIYTTGLVSKGKKIRFSGVRPYELIDKLVDMGHDATDGSLTKDTDILIIPYNGYTSTKTKSIGTNTKVVVLNDFNENMDAYL